MDHEVIIMTIPDFIESPPWHSDILPLIWTRADLARGRSLRSPQPIPLATGGSLPPGSPVEIDDGKFIIVLEKIGEGHQGVVYSIMGCDDFCIKICKNQRAQKQLRRELFSAHHFQSRGISYPDILAADGGGRWIIKMRLKNSETGSALLARHQGHLPRRQVELLGDYVRKFEKDNLCVDWMPSNVIFGQTSCLTFETSLWSSPVQGWSFSRCFLPFWIPNGVPESAVVGFPPYNIDLGLLDCLKERWDHDASYSAWRQYFGRFPDFHCDWWTLVTLGSN
jgi:hypothetical protein